jgi:beta-glucosidase
VATDDEFAQMMGRPITPVPPLRPFHRNSTLEDLETTRVGRLISGRVVAEGIKRASVEFPDPDDATIAMVRAAMREGPLRAAVLMGGGALSFDALDRTIELFNGQWGTALRQIVKRG